MVYSWPEDKPKDERDLRDKMIDWMSVPNNERLVVLAVLTITLGVMFLIVVDNVDSAEVHAISRQDCGVLASKYCGERGLVSVVSYNVTNNDCVYCCRLTLQQQTAWRETWRMIRLMRWLGVL